MTAHQQGEAATIQNCSCWQCSEGQRTQAHSMTEYLVGQQDPRPCGDHIVHNRVEAVPADRAWAPQTARTQDNFGYAPVHERAGPSNLEFGRTPDEPISESRRRLASRYLNNPNTYRVCTSLCPSYESYRDQRFELEATSYASESRATVQKKKIQNPPKCSTRNNPQSSAYVGVTVGYFHPRSLVNLSAIQYRSKLPRRGTGPCETLQVGRHSATEGGQQKIARKVSARGCKSAQKNGLTVVDRPTRHPKAEFCRQKLIVDPHKFQGPHFRLGKSGLKVSRIILGMMSYGDPHWQPWILGEKEAIKHVKFAYEHGVNTFDTANLYSNGLSEVYLGNAIKALNLPREEIVVMTKLFFAVGKIGDEGMWKQTPAELDKKGFVNQHGLSRKNIFDSVKKSLERLQLDYIDVLQCHRFDPDTPIEETMQALHDVVQAGYVRYIGMSTLPRKSVTSSLTVDSVHVMQNYAIANNLTPFISMQNHHSLVYREEEREMFPTLNHFGVGIIPWSSLARGLLTRPLKTDLITTRANTDLSHRYTTEYLQGAGTQEIVHRVEEISQKRKISMAQVSLAWSLTHVTAPVVGSTSLKNLEELIDGTEITLTPEEIRYLEEPYKARSVVGH
ncbi:NADP-dependent oxidoreductase domain-containing protein [Lactarius quietus]|nr:NADP-dependent oxidoreductase domain-containing protein [Lactarius quietus]